MLKLICVNACIIRKWSQKDLELVRYHGDYLKKKYMYTSQGTSINEDGHLCYIIEELKGRATREATVSAGLRLVGRFIEVVETCEVKTIDRIVEGVNLVTSFKVTK